jgi:tryptophanyl-tRNA synthetase
LLYPVLQAADVLAYRAHEVPVGEDQREHLELMRDVARRFNARFGDGEEVLVVPEHRIPEVGARIMDLQDPASKMSTTGGSSRGPCMCSTSPSAIEKKLKSAVTDSGSEVRRAPGEAGREQPDRDPRGRPRVDPAASRPSFARRATAN